MLYEGKYEVDQSFVNNGSIFWKYSGNGAYIIATYDGKKYFIERSMHIRRPYTGLPKIIYNKYKSLADSAFNRYRKLKELTNHLTLENDHIVVAENVFWDSDDQLATITRCVPNPLGGDFDYTSLSFGEFINLAKSAALALSKVHDCGIIRCDLCESNIVVSKDDNSYVAYLLGFDEYLYVGDASSWECSSINEYNSPEIMAYNDAYNDEFDETSKEELKRAITPATDIYSLGVIFHKWWTNKLPNEDEDKPVVIDDKFDVSIGNNYKVSLKALINWMLSKDPARRPTAGQVLNVLSDRAGID